MNAAAAAFAATECIKAGEWDGYLPELWRVVRERRMLTDRSKSPTIPTPERHQVWAWMTTRHAQRRPVGNSGHGCYLG